MRREDKLLVYSVCANKSQLTDRRVLYWWYLSSLGQSTFLSVSPLILNFWWSELSFTGSYYCTVDRFAASDRGPSDLACPEGNPRVGDFHKAVHYGELKRTNACKLPAHHHNHGSRLRYIFDWDSASGKAAHGLLGWLIEAKPGVACRRDGEIPVVIAVISITKCVELNAFCRDSASADTHCTMDM